MLNEGNDHRILFIAANFRREVTATVLWLREHAIDARCIKVVPYRFDDEFFIDLQQVIPPPEAADYMIRMVEKGSEEKSAKAVQGGRHRRAWRSGRRRWESFEPPGSKDGRISVHPVTAG